MKIFISYEQKDLKFVEQLGKSLKAIGIHPFTNNLKEFLGRERRSRSSNPVSRGTATSS